MHASSHASRSLLLLLLPAGVFAADLPADGHVDFNRDVQPILSANCLVCHGPDESTRKAKLRLDVRDEAIASRDGIAAIVPGDTEASELFYRISATDTEEIMPPPETGHKLTAADIQLVGDWIKQGAEYAEHWAFLPPAQAPLPEVAKPVWSRNPIDRFVLARLEQEKLAPAKPTARATLIRRATLDLTGLPPTPAEVDAFVNDRSPDAFAKVIDRLLASPHYGERWGRHWLDVARYADSGGFETDLFFAHAWRYRDYVIRAFNADKPFDRFIKEQIAGDELYPDNEEARLATGLYTTGPVLQEAGMVAGKLEYDQLTDAVDTTGSAFLGLTVGCARCHDHKYDPISQKDYFRLHGIFAASDQVDFAADGTKLRERAALKTTLKEFEAEQARLRAQNEKDSVKRDEYLRQVGDGFIASDEELNRRVERTKRYLTLSEAVERYRLAASQGVTAGETVPSEAELAAVDDGDNNAVALNAALAGVAKLQPSDPLEAMLVDLGRLALQTAPRGDMSRRKFRELKTDEEKRAFLLDSGRQQLDVQKPDDFIADLDAFRREIGVQHVNDATPIPVRVLAHRETPLEIRLLKRGELEMAGDVVEPGLPLKLAANPSLEGVPASRRRAALAEWIASDENLLTARVIVNRVWQWHFGQGLVPTPNDFGIRGERPTHPELLDWLAVEFMQRGWSLKQLHRLIMSSQTYQMSAEVDAATLERDPDNRLLTRYQPRRLEAEAIWDSLRAVAGTLDLTLFGLPIAPPLDDQEQIGNFRKWPTSTPEEANRRAIYILVKRSFRFPMLSAFDPPDNIASCGRRDITTVPNQALTLLNNRMVTQFASAFADRVLRETNGRLDDVPAQAWRHAYGRNVTDGEKRAALQFLRERQKAPSSFSTDATHAAVTELALALFNTNEFIYLP